MAQVFNELRRDNVREAIYEDVEQKFDTLRSNFSGDVFPENPFVGQFCFKTDESKMYHWNGEEWKEVGSGSGSGRNVGDIFYTSRLDSELNGAVEANGSVYNVADFTGEQSVHALLADGKLPYVSMAEYESILSAKGSCRAFGWDNGDTFRVPKLNNVYLMAGTAGTAGEFINESLPNLKGYFAQWKAQRSDGVLFKSTGIGAISNSNDGGADPAWRTDFNARAYSSAYQDGAKVRPDSVRYRAMVQLANEATNEALITATSVIQQVANKIDRQGNETVVETYRNGNNWYNIYSNGWCEMGNIFRGSDAIVTVSFLKEFVSLPSIRVGVYGYYNQNFLSGVAAYDFTTPHTVNLKNFRVKASIYGCCWEAKGYIR